MVQSLKSALRFTFAQYSARPPSFAPNTATLLGLMECPCTSVQSRLGRHASPGPVFESEGVEFVVVSVAIGFLVNPLTKSLFLFSVSCSLFVKKEKKNNSKKLKGK